MKKYFTLYVILIAQLSAGIIQPLDGSILNYVHVMFKWEAESDATEYEFELYQNNNQLKDFHIFVLL